MKKFLALLLALAMVFSVTACGGGGGDDGEKVIKIGLCQPMTGSMAASGTYSKQGVDLAIQQINDAGGLDIGGEKYTVELVVQDNEGKTDVTINAFNKLIGDDKVTAIIGTNSSGTTKAAGPLATEAKVPVVATTATAADVTQVGGEYVFRSCWIDPYQGYLAAKMAYDLLGLRKGAVLFNNADDYSTSIKDVFVESFEEMGGEVMTQAYAGADVKDFKAQLTAIQEFGGEFIFIEAQAAEIPLPIQQIKELGMDEMLLGAASWDSELLPELAGADNIEGSYFISTFSPQSEDPLAVEYVAAFQEAYDNLPNNQSTMSYNAMMIIADALERCGTLDDPEALRDAIAATDIDLPSGHLVFDENRDPQVTGNVLTYENGTPVFIQTIS